MKKKLIVLSSIVMFSIGLALYANNSSTMKVLSEDNIEALTDGESLGNPIQETGKYPHRVWIDHEAHTITMEGYHKVKGESGKYECTKDSGSTCQMSSDSPVRKTLIIVKLLETLMKIIFDGLPFWKWVVGLFV